MLSSSTNVILLATFLCLSVLVISLPISLVGKSIPSVLAKDNTTFNCTGAVCQACVGFNLFDKPWNLCVDLGYEDAKQDYLIELELNGNVLYRHDIPSFSSDPRLCTPLPFVVKLEETCIDFSDYYVDANGNAHSCAFLTGAGFFSGHQDFNISLGCFQLPQMGNMNKVHLK